MKHKKTFQKIFIRVLSFAVVFVFLLAFQTSFAQRDFSDLEQAIEQKKRLLGNNLVVMIVNNDSIIYQKAYGSFDNKTQVPIASCSKWLTATLVMQLVDEGKLSLDDKVSKYLPVFENNGKENITIRHCLSHQTGIQSERISLLGLLARRKYNSLEEEINDFAKKEIRANAGEDFWYGNIGLNIAARVAEVVTKKKFEQLIQQKLFVPLGMHNTTFATDNGTAPNPSGGAKSTAADYMQFLQMLLNNGKYNGKQILSEASVAEMRKVQITKSQIKYAPPAAEGFLYALGSWALTPSPSPSKMERGAMAEVLACPGLFGTWPMVDYSRGYACIFLVKSYLGEQKADAYLELKKVIDGHFKVKGK